jgi:hypothetical protein
MTALVSYHLSNAIKKKEKRKRKKKRVFQAFSGSSV